MSDQGLSKRRRGWVLLVLVAAITVISVSGVILSNRALDGETESFIRSAAAQFAGTDASTVAAFDPELDLSDGAAAELDAFLAVDGRDPVRLELEANRYEATYEVETWGRQNTVIVTWTDDRVDVTRP